MLDRIDIGSITTPDHTTPHHTTHVLLALSVFLYFQAQEEEEDSELLIDFTGYMAKGKALCKSQPNQHSQASHILTSGSAPRELQNDGMQAESSTGHTHRHQAEVSDMAPLFDIDESQQPHDAAICFDIDESQQADDAMRFDIADTQLHDTATLIDIDDSPTAEQQKPTHACSSQAAGQNSAHGVASHTDALSDRTAARCGQRYANRADLQSPGVVDASASGANRGHVMGHPTDPPAMLFDIEDDGACNTASLAGLQHGATAQQATSAAACGGTQLDTESGDHAHQAARSLTSRSLLPDTAPKSSRQQHGTGSRAASAAVPFICQLPVAAKGASTGGQTGHKQSQPAADLSMMFHTADDEDDEKASEQRVRHDINETDCVMEPSMSEHHQTAPGSQSCRAKGLLSLPSAHGLLFDIADDCPHRGSKPAAPPTIKPPGETAPGLLFDIEDDDNDDNFEAPPVAQAQTASHNPASACAPAFPASNRRSHSTCNQSLRAASASAARQLPVKGIQTLSTAHLQQQQGVTKKSVQSFKPPRRVTAPSAATVAAEASAGEASRDGDAADMASARPLKRLRKAGQPETRVSTQPAASDEYGEQAHL